MDLSQMTFGIEIETTIPAGRIPVGQYHGSTQAQGLPAGWKAMRDGSLIAPAGREGCEFVSPILSGAEGLKQVVEVVKILKEQIGAEVNPSCGFHVHVGFRGQDAKALARLVTLTANFEKAIYASTGTKRRETSVYCRPVSRHGEAGAMLRTADRYQVLNTTNLAPGRSGTVEFRAFAGTLNAVKMISYIRLCLGLVQRAVEAKRTTNWAAAATKDTSPIKRSGEGQTALTRLFYQLGWIKGRTDRTYGVLEVDGVPTLKDSKRQLMKLARKYDGGAEDSAE